METKVAPDTLDKNKGIINYVLDTNVLLHDPMAFKNFGEHHVVIPAIVLEELESKKKQMSKVGESARTFTRELMKIREETGKKLGERINFEREIGGSFTIEMNHQAFEGMGDFSDKKVNDNRILSVAKNIYNERKVKNEKTVVISMDVLMIAKVDVLAKHTEEFKKAMKLGENFDAFEGQLYKHDRLVDNSDSIHTGVHRIYLENEMISSFYKGQEIKVSTIEDKFEKEHFPGDFVVMKDVMNPSSSAMGRVKTKQNELVITPFINGKPNFNHIKPRNVEQYMMAEALLDANVKLLCVRGEAGSGKTLLSLAAAIEMLENKGYDYNKMLVGRPIVEMGKGIGFLPGEIEDKLRPWLMPIYDNLEFYFKADNQAELEKILIQKDYIEIQALTYIRGRSLPNQLIIIDEAQNLTPHEVKTIVSRAGENTKVILLGDTKQIDHAYLDEINNGLTYAIERLKHEESVVTLKLEKTERSPLADLAIKHL